MYRNHTVHMLNSTDASDQNKTRVLSSECWRSSLSVFISSGSSCSNGLIWIRLIWVWKCSAIQDQVTRLTSVLVCQSRIGSDHPDPDTLFQISKSGSLVLYSQTCWWRENETGKKLRMFCIVFTQITASDFKVQGFFIRHILNYTGYNQKWNVKDFTFPHTAPYMRIVPM